MLLSVTSYLVASNQALNFLEQRESVNLTLQMAVAVSGLMVLLIAGDGVSGERERETLETLLLTSAPPAVSCWARLPPPCRCGWRVSW